jgi:hypothetical protein
MASVITLDGLKNGKLGRRYRKNCKTRKAYSPTLGKEVDVCVDSIGSLGALEKTKRKSKKKKSGQRIACEATKTVRNKKTGRKMCFCTNPKHQILPNSECGLPAKQGGK